jgi:HD-GYP domain-containing protein (c-di-GMP phosphodiesterase class II)
MDIRDQETEGHTQRVTEMTVRLAEKMGISDEQIVHISYLGRPQSEFSGV